uniref:SFRICE_025092 n=1 Tax=Spodoptera frugiperda TaxID=7108 RepID=A0A2H1VWI8_SPOFR
MVFFMAYEQTYHLMISNRRCPWTLETPLQVRCRPFGIRNLRVVLESGIGKIGKGGIGPPVTSLRQRKHCFTSVFGEAVVSLRSSRPIRVEAWLTHNKKRGTDEIIEKDRNARQSAIRAGRHVAGAPKRGFFGTIFHVILEQINDTKSAYNQISDLVNNQFADDNAVTTTPDPSNNGTTESPKITRAEFLKILDRNLKGLSRLRNLEWREAKKDSAANIRMYKDEIFRGKKARSTR